MKTDFFTAHGAVAPSQRSFLGGCHWSVTSVSEAQRIVIFLLDSKLIEQATPTHRKIGSYGALVWPDVGGKARNEKLGIY